MRSSRHSIFIALVYVFLHPTAAQNPMCLDIANGAATVNRLDSGASPAFNYGDGANAGWQRCKEIGYKRPGKQYLKARDNVPVIVSARGNDDQAQYAMEFSGSSKDVRYLPLSP